VHDNDLLRVRVQGPAVASGRIAVDDLVVLVCQLQMAVERIALVLAGGRGMRRGRRPAGIERLTRLEVVALRRGSVELGLDLRREQETLAGMDVGRQAAHLLVDGIGALREREALPQGWDAGVLIALRETARLFRRGIESVDLSVRADGRRRSATLRPADAERVARVIAGPVSHRRTVEGRLLMADFKEPGTRCRLHPAIGPAVECTFDETHRQAVLDALTRYVRVTGDAEIEPETGTIRRLAIADIEMLDWDDTEEVAYPFWEPLGPDELAERQGVGPVARVEDLASDIWQSDEELQEFVVDTYAERTADRPR
jgi:hypothetical protein